MIFLKVPLTVKTGIIVSLNETYRRYRVALDIGGEAVFYSTMFMSIPARFPRLGEKVAVTYTVSFDNLYKEEVLLVKALNRKR